MIGQWINTRSYKVRPSVWVFALLVMIIGGLTVFFISHAHKRYYQQPIGADVEARRNPFLAAQYFMQQLGKELVLQRELSMLDQELNPYHAMIISNSRKPLNQRRIEALLAYVEQGGHLILNAVEEFDDDRGQSGAPILDQLGARLYPYEGEVERIDEQADESERDDSDRYFSRFTFDGYEQPTEVLFNGYRYLIDASGEAIFIGGTNDADHIIQYEHGEGVITVLSDMEFWQNKRIEQADHAMFLHQLTENYDKVWMIYNPQVPSLWRLFWQHGYFLVVSIAILLLVVIWFHQIKTGPVFPQFSNDSRKLLQHIKAAGEFKWHRCQPQVLLEQLRDELLGRVKQRSLQFEKLSKQNQIDYLTRVTELPEQSIQLALFQNYSDQTTFVEQIKILQQIRKHINRKVI